MMRLTAALLVRLGLVLLALAVLGRLLPMPNRADVMADEFAIVVSLVLVLVAAIYLRLTRDPAESGPRPAAPSRRQDNDNTTSDLNASNSAVKGDAK